MKTANGSAGSDKKYFGGRKKSVVLIVAVVVMLTLILSITLTACDKDENQNWTVTFVGDGVTTPAQTVPNGYTAIKPVNPVLSGYTFLGWLLDGTTFDFNTPITGNITLVAQWQLNGGDTPGGDQPSLPTSMTGTGTKEDPYVLYSANDLINFSSRVNNPTDPNNTNFYKSYFKLGTDIDMSAVPSFTPAGRQIVNGDTTTNYPFEGVFDGAGHKISNLQIRQNLRQGMYNVGFFGLTNEAIIKDVNFENINYVVEGGADTDSIKVRMGGVSGISLTTVFLGIHVSGKMEARLYSSNVGNIGGLSGGWEIASGKYAYTENCFVDVEITPGRFSDDDSAATPDSAQFGGFFAYVYNVGAAAAIINSSSAGRVIGGYRSGGFVGVAMSDGFSIVNCASSMIVQVTSRSTFTYAGGLIGITSSDVLIMDSVYCGTVVGSKPTNNEYQGYAGALVGDAALDAYNIEYVPGIAVVNTYYSATVSNCDVRSQFGTSLSSGVKPDIAWAKTQLGWDEAIWSSTDTVAFVPTSTYAANIQSSVKLVFDNNGTKTEDVRTVEGRGGYPYIGTLEDLATQGTNVFWNWEIADGVNYRYYMPLIKDTTLTAKWYDVSSIVGIYTGTGTLHESIDAGIFELKADGTMQWLQSGAINGTYKCDGNHIILNTFSWSIGSVAGTINNGHLEFTIQAGMSGDVLYEFDKTTLKYFGEYYSEDGDIIAFTGTDSLSLLSFKIGNNTVKGSFTLDPANDTSINVSSGMLTGYFSSMTVEYIDSTSIRVNFVGKDSYPSINATFSKITSDDYTGRAFVGRWSITNASNYSPFHAERFILTLNADGSASVASRFSETKAKYHVFGDKILLDYDGYICLFTYYQDMDVLFGIYNRGSSYTRNMVCMRVADGISVEDMDSYCYVINPNTYEVINTPGYQYIKTAVYKCGNQAYYVENGEFKPNAVITGTFAENSVVTIDGIKYIAIKGIYGSSEGYSLVLMGAENGTYTYNGRTVTLNGIGGGTIGNQTLQYWVLESPLVVVLTDTDEFFAFDYTVAQSAGNTITAKEHDGYQGVWYSDKTESSLSPAREKYYKLVLDGFGHATIFYYSEDKGGYSFNWGNWGYYTMSPAGVVARFNSSQSAEFSFYYDMGLVYTRSFAYENNPRSFYKANYTGSLEPPALPANVVGSYTGEESDGTQVVFNLRADLTGSYKGVAFIGVYDGTSNVRFAINSINYTFNLTSKTLAYGSENVLLTLGGEVTEVIPASLCGAWTGTVTGYGTGNGQQVTVTISTEGAVAYGTIMFSATYDIATGVITGSSAGNSITLTYNAEDRTMKVSATIGDYTYTGTLSKAA